MKSKKNVFLFFDKKAFLRSNHKCIHYGSMQISTGLDYDEQRINAMLFFCENELKALLSQYAKGTHLFSISRKLLSQDEKLNQLILHSNRYLNRGIFFNSMQGNFPIRRSMYCYLRVVLRWIRLLKKAIITIAYPLFKSFDDFKDSIYSSIPSSDCLLGNMKKNKRMPEE